jgi:AcrR family transcriptional regulator
VSTAPANRRPAFQESRARILAAARELFGQRGYQGTTTKELADAAGVAEKTLFRHFPTKGALFKDAVITPFHQFISAYVEEWDARPKGVRDEFDETRSLYEGLFEMLDANRGLVFALLSAQAFEDPDSEQFPELHNELNELLSKLGALLEFEANARGYAMNAPILTRVIFGLALVSTVHADWLFPAGIHPGRDKLVAELTELTVRGVRSA